MTLTEEPELTIMYLLRNNWQDGATDAGFDTNHISTGWFQDNRDHPQITVSHTGDSLPGVTGYTAISPEGPTAFQRGRSQVDIWVPNTDDWSSPGKAKRHRWQMFQECKRIIHLHADGVANDAGEQEFANLGTISSRRITEDDREPIVFRGSLDVRYVYHQRPPVE